MAGWNIEFQVLGKSAAVEQVDFRRDAQEIPGGIAMAIKSLIAILPETDLDGYNTLNVRSHGHLRDNQPGLSDCTILVQFMADPEPEPEE